MKVREEATQKGFEFGHLQEMVVYHHGRRVTAVEDPVYRLTCGDGVKPLLAVKQ